MRLRRWLSARIHAAKCSGGCYCVKDRFVWRCTVCGHIC